MLSMPGSTVVMPSRTHSSEDAFADDCIAHGFDLRDDPNGNDDILRATFNGEYIRILEQENGRRFPAHGSLDS